MPLSNRKGARRRPVFLTTSRVLRAFEVFSRATTTSWLSRGSSFFVSQTAHHLCGAVTVIPSKNNNAKNRPAQTHQQQQTEVEKVEKEARAAGAGTARTPSPSAENEEASTETTQNSGVVQGAAAGASTTQSSSLSKHALMSQALHDHEQKVNNIFEDGTNNEETTTTSREAFDEQQQLIRLHAKTERDTASHQDHPYTVTTDPNGARPAWVTNPLAEYFFKYTTGLKIWKWHHYFQVYHRHLDPLRAYRDQRLNMLVIGVQSGGEVGMWREYFGPNLHYYGIDVNPACKQIEQKYPNTKIFIGDQSDASFLASVQQEIAASGAPLHIVLDDGSHIAWHQIATFETMYPHLHIYNGVYIVEDVTTNYGAPQSSVHMQQAPASILSLPAVSSQQESFVEHMKTRVDYVNGYWKFAQPGAPVNPWNDPFVTSVNDISFYDGMVVVEKSPHPHPTQEHRGTEDIPYCTPGQQNGCLT
ncbi:unnamed protein product [Amoebophrya sp. A120]|nr:unnamed protein product [Amoebophrya sp. A120]|eukprot:GSA120T00000308001.1